MAKKRIHLVHGWTYSIDNWADFIKQLEQAGFEPVLHRVPGLTTPSDEVWTIEKYIEWLHGELGSEQELILVGHSNGGRILLTYVQKYPAGVEHLVLIGAAGLVDRDKALAVKKKVGQVVAKILKPIVPDGKPRRVMYRLIGARDYGNAKPNMRETMKNMHKHDHLLQPENIQIPATLIWGEYDKAIPVRLGEELRDRLPKVVSWNVLKAGHSPQIHHADEVVQIIKRDVLGS